MFVNKETPLYHVYDHICRKEGICVTSLNLKDLELKYVLKVIRIYIESQTLSYILQI